MPLFGRWRSGQSDKDKQAKGAAQSQPVPTPEKAQAGAGEGGALPPKRALPVVAATGTPKDVPPMQITRGGKTPIALPMANGGGGGPRSLPMANAPAPGARALPVMPAAPGNDTVAIKEPDSPFQQAVKRAVATIHDPEIGRPMVELGMVKDLTFAGQSITIAIELTTPACPMREQIEQNVRETILAVPGVEKVEVTLTARVRAASTAGRAGLAGVKNTIAVASGKGGVGKSTVTANLAIALARDGAKVGLLDADVYGPSMPLMLDLQGRQPKVRSVPPAIPGEKATQKLIPLEAHGIKVMSIGFLVDPEKPVIWRGPMASQLINQFLNDVEWEELDYLLIDMPPGTGDIHLTLTQRLPLSGAIIVTTPQDVALADAVKGLQMFKEVQVPILGIVENMSYFICPGCGEKTAIFGEGGGSWASERYDVPLLGQIPLARAIREAGDSGQPIVVTDPESPQALAFRDTARAAAGRLSMEAALTGGKRASGPLIQIKRKKAE